MKTVSVADAVGGEDIECLFVHLYKRVSGLGHWSMVSVASGRPWYFLGGLFVCNSLGACPFYWSCLGLPIAPFGAFLEEVMSSEWAFPVFSGYISAPWSKRLTSWL